MALTPAAMMNLRRGPTQGPTPNPGGDMPGGPGGAPGAPGAGMPATPGAQSPGNLLMTAIAQRMNEQKKSNVNFASQNIDQVKRIVALTQIHVGQMHAEAARDLHKAWAALDSAQKKLNESEKESSVPVGPPLGFSGAGIRGGMAGGPPGVGPGNGGGGMGGPS